MPHVWIGSDEDRNEDEGYEPEFSSEYGQNTDFLEELASREGIDPEVKLNINYCKEYFELLRAYLLLRHAAEEFIERYSKCALDKKQ